MAKTHEEVIREHIIASELAEGIKITKFHLDYDIECSTEDLEKQLSRIRENQKLLNQIDPLTMALAKIAHYEEILRKIGKFGQSKISDWLEMPESERKLRHELFSMSDMGK